MIKFAQAILVPFAACTTIDLPRIELLALGTSEVYGSVILQNMVSLALYSDNTAAYVKDADVPFIAPYFPLRSPSWQVWGAVASHGGVSVRLAGSR